MSGQVKLSEIFYVNPKHINPKSAVAGRDCSECWNRWVAWSGRDEDINTRRIKDDLSVSDYKKWRRWDRIKKDILTNGFDDKRPLLIYLDWGGYRIWDGNHRLTIATDLLKLDYVPVRFRYMIYDTACEFWEING